MRIALAALDYPPLSTEGIARQRQVLAEALARLGHEVHVVTLGEQAGSTEQASVHVHRHPRGAAANEFLPELPVLNRPLTDAQQLCEGVLDLAAQVPIDVVDVPLWLAQPLALVRHAPCPVVIWLQTTLLHLVELQHRQPRAHERVLADIDRYGLSAAAGCIADSRSILADVERLYGLPGLHARTAVVHPGLPAEAPVPSTRQQSGVEALVVGRLEQRKGTRVLFEALPRLLEQVPGLRVRFVGRDNSGADGFRRETGRSYPEAFVHAHPALAARVRFDGYVDEATLTARYGTADLLLHPALYESFGLIFLEAMRAGLPVVAFRGGGAAEVFARGERDGALLCEPGDVDGLIDAARELLERPDRRAALGRAGRAAFEAAFTSERMARETADAYARVLEREGHRSTPRRPTRVFQVMEALQDRDAVSRIARTNAVTLAELGAARPIMAVFSEASVRHETGRLRAARFAPTDAAIFHFWGFSRLERMITRFTGRKAIHYHNITPPKFFAGRTPHYEMTARGYAQLSRIADAFDLVIGDSTYNLDAYARHLSTPKPALCLYPVVDGRALQAASWDETFAAGLRADAGGPVWLFVGRFAPNKRQDQVMRAFDRFVSATGGGRLVLVGDTTAVPVYVDLLTELRARLRHGARIHFVPSVPDDQLRACYRAADLFVCASEHEGFCVPLAEAMAFDVPTLALDRGAVGETMGSAGVLVPDWNPQTVATLAADVLSPDRRAAIVAAQHDRLRAFSPAAIRTRLEAVVRFLCDGVESPLFVRQEPRRAADERRAS